MAHHVSFPSFLGLLCLASPTWAADAMPGIGPVGEIKRLHTGLQFVEGPASDGKGNLYFTDIPANRIYQVDVVGKLSNAIEPSHHANGLMFDGAGRLVACEMDGTVVLRDLATGKRTVLADQYDGNRFNAPNDLVIDRGGGVYYTDPRFRAPEPWPQGKEAFYYRQPGGDVMRLSDTLPTPNGIILSPDEKTLYVICSLRKEVMGYPVRSPGVLGEGRVFCTLRQPEGMDNTGGDGATVDTKGNLYITSRLGVQVFSPGGKWLGVIEFPEQPANVTFGGKENRTLFVTARTSLYACEMEATGHVFSGRVKVE